MMMRVRRTKIGANCLVRNSRTVRDWWKTLSSHRRRRPPARQSATPWWMMRVGAGICPPPPPCGQRSRWISIITCAPHAISAVNAAWTLFEAPPPTTTTNGRHWTPAALSERVACITVIRGACVKYPLFPAAAADAGGFGVKTSFGENPTEVEMGHLSWPTDPFPSLNPKHSRKKSLRSSHQTYREPVTTVWKLGGLM